MPDQAGDGLSYALRLEIGRIERSAGVVPGSVRFEKQENGERLAFLMETEATTEPPKADVRDVEGVSFIYGSNRRIGETAPTNVVMEREDFPKHVGHVCSAGDEGLAVPCLAIGGTQPLYERAGIEAVMVRLRDFLRDAKTGALMADGWEPVPFAVDQAFRLGEISPRFFQEYAIANPTTGGVTGVAVDREDEKGAYVFVLPQVIALDKMVSAVRSKVEKLEKVDDGSGTVKTEVRRRGIPWVFLWLEPTSTQAEPIYGNWRSVSELRKGMERLGVIDAFDAQVGGLLAKGLDFQVYRPGTGGKGLVVILGAWRPSPISAEYFGYSDDQAARKLELRAFMVSQKLMKGILDDDAEVETIMGDHPPTPDLLRWVAGIRALPPIALVGVGALGSAVFASLVRSGLEDVTVIDDDLLHTHNLARHTAGIGDLYRPKVEHAERLAADVAREGLTVQILREDVTRMAIDALSDLCEGRLVVDASADERVRLKLDELRSHRDMALVRAEMFHEGRLGVTFVSPAGGPTLSDMMLSLVASAPDEPAVALWLEYEEANPFGPVPLLYGFGCTSQTVHLPSHAIIQHASVATATILDARGEAGIALNPLDDGFRPMGWRWLPVDPFTTLVPTTSSDWTVRLSGSAAKDLAEQRAKALPLETGGYLYGGWDPVRGTITITSVTPLPAGSVCSPTELTLRPAGDTLEERRLLRKTRERIHLCGTWHSHVGASARMSSRDYRTMTTHWDRDAADLKPTLMVVVADGAMAAHLMLP